MTPWSQAEIQAEPVVSYSTIHPTVKTGDLVFMSGRYAISRAIRYFTKSPWSHVGMLAWIEGRLLVLESVEDHGVRFAPLSRYLTEYRGEVLIASIEKLNPLQIKHAFGYALDHLTTPYGYGQLAGILLRLASGFERSRAGGLICSELVAESYGAGGVMFHPSIADYVTPQDVWCDPRVKYIARLK